MVQWRSVALVLTLFCCASAASGEERASPARAVLDDIALSPDGRGFILRSSGRPWIPWGFNYDHDDTSGERLIEDYWDTEWHRVERDFREMKALGANVVRVHLQLGRFMNGVDDANAQALVRLHQLVGLAEETGLYLDITGLGGYRPGDAPAWLETSSERDRWDAQANFWRAVAATVANSTAVFCLNLMNEPAVPDRDQATWHAPPWVNGRTYVEMLTRSPGKRPRGDIARAWLHKMVAAVRQEDTRHLVTVGNFLIGDQAEQLPIGLSPDELAKEIDFLSVHLYPGSAALTRATDALRRLHVGKPVLVEETGPLSCSVDALRGLMRASPSLAAGWMGFYWGGTPEQLRSSGKPQERLEGETLQMFHELAPREQRERGPSRR
jgi:hypothetical protein